MTRRPARDARVAAALASLGLLLLSGCYGSLPAASDIARADLPDSAADAEQAPDAPPDAEVADTDAVSGPDADVASDGDAGLDGAADTDLGPDSDAAADLEVAPPGPCDKDQPGLTRTVVVPQGETLFFDGDDYLAFWGADHPCEVVLGKKPAGAQSQIEGTHPAQRLTLDRAGTWEIYRGPDTIVLDVSADALTPDTFLNYNYSPTSPLALAGGDIWVASPVSNAVQRVRVAGDTVELGELVPTGSWPTALAADDDLGFMVVAQTGRDTIGFIDLETRRVFDAIRVGNEPAGLALDTTPTGELAVWVALSGEDRVVRVELDQGGAISASVDVGRDPRAMVLDAAQRKLFVASLVSSNAHPRGPLQEAPLGPEDSQDIAIIDADAGTLVGYVPDVGTIIRGIALDPVHPKRLIAGVSHSDNTIMGVDASKHPISHGLAIIDIDPESPTAWTVIQQVDLDHQESSSGPAPSPFTIQATPAGDLLLVTLSAGAAILMLDPETYAEVGRIPTGSDPRGLLTTGGRLYTYAWLDNQLESWTIPTVHSPADLAHSALSVGADPTPLEIKQGQRMFNDASFSARGEFSCNNCHIDALTDGLVWDLLADGPVNTIAFRNVGGTSPFLWGGQLPTLFDFSREVLKLVGAEASGSQMELLTLYMQSVTAPPNPFTEPGGRLDAAGVAGRELFQTPVEEGGGGCAECHSGPLLTNRSLEDGKTEGVKTDVPSLYGAYDTGPWGRQGQWTTLESMVAFAADFTKSTLDDEELAALTAYVREQPSESLYLTSSTPLADSAHVWYETPIELTFSDVLAPGQVDAFNFFRLDGDPDASTQTLVPGAWTVSGRFARFAPTEPLALDTRYSIQVDGTLEGRFGSGLGLPLEIAYETGGLPGLDVSGQWNVKLFVTQFGQGITVTMALIQSTGGQVTGVVVENFNEASIDHIEGVVDGDVLALDPFIVNSQIGPFPVENGVIIDMQDTDGDGFGDKGEGTTSVTALGDTYDVVFTFTRKALPQGVDAP
ncbi:MAG: Ig-like domain-containing protein [Deltaproteobacteria bacterium]|nr:Ig-like domain-containing protein [Deltaproteobacteria bacterium]MCB9787004.1 Ig-like domain-containing protein [Deltaproteobacteria bacterium]